MSSCMKLFAAALTLAAAPASADDALTRLLGHPSAKTKAYGCFTRVYDDAHLAQHPQQNVRKMVMLISRAAESEGVSGYELRIGSKFRSRKGLLDTGGNCHASQEPNAPNDKIECSVSCDGGQIGVTIEASGKVLVAIPNGARLWDPAKPEEDNVKGGFGPDDKIFRLERASIAACAAEGEDAKEKALLKRMK